MDRHAKELEPLLRLADMFLQASGSRQVGEAQSDLSATCASAFAMGLVRGRWGKVEPFGVPLDLGLGALLLLLGQSGVLGSRVRTVNAVAASALAAYFTTWGATIGSRMKFGLPVTAPQAASAAEMNGNSGATAKRAAPLTDSQVLQSVHSIIAN